MEEAHKFIELFVKKNRPCDSKTLVVFAVMATLSSTGHNQSINSFKDVKSFLKEFVKKNFKTSFPSQYCVLCEKTFLIERHEHVTLILPRYNSTFLISVFHTNLFHSLLIYYSLSLDRIVVNHI